MYGGMSRQWEATVLTAESDTRDQMYIITMVQVECGQKNLPAANYTPPLFSMTETIPFEIESLRVKSKP